MCHFAAHLFAIYELVNPRAGTLLWPGKEKEHSMAFLSSGGKLQVYAVAMQLLCRAAGRLRERLRASLGHRVEEWRGNESPPLSHQCELRWLSRVTA